MSFTRNIWRGSMTRIRLLRKRHTNRHGKTTQRELRTMKEAWWANIASELQAAADTRDMRSFYHNLKQVIGPKQGGTTPIHSRDGTSLLSTHKSVRYHESLDWTLQLCPQQKKRLLIHQFCQRSRNGQQTTTLHFLPHCMKLTVQ